MHHRVQLTCWRLNPGVEHAGEALCPQSPGFELLLGESTLLESVLHFKVIALKVTEIHPLEQYVLHSVSKRMHCPPSDPNPAFTPALPM